MKNLIGLLTTLVVTLTLSSAEATMIDRDAGVRTLCNHNGIYETLCNSSETMVTGVRIVPDYDFITNSTEQAAVMNIEVFDDQGTQLFIGTPKRVLLSRHQWVTLHRESMGIPASVTRNIPRSQLMWIEIWVYVAGPRFDTQDAHRVFVKINEKLPTPPVIPSPPIIPTVVTPPVIPTPSAIPAPNCVLHAVPSIVVSGGRTILSWTTTNAAAVSIDHNLGAMSFVDLGSAQSPVITADTKFTLTATGPGGTVHCAVTVTIKTPSPTPCPPNCVCSEHGGGCGSGHQS